MDDFDTSVMIALLPITTEWCKIECPHLTLVYAGEIRDLKPIDFNALAKDAASISMLARPVTLKVTGVEVFGEEDKVDVLKFEASSELLAMRSMVEDWNASEFPFNPHATIGPIGTSMLLQSKPEYVTFNRIMVGWGKDYITFWLRMFDYG